MQQISTKSDINHSSDTVDAPPKESAITETMAPSNNVTNKTAVYWPLTHIAVPDFIANLTRKFGHSIDEGRKKTITALPSPIVNNSSNVIGFMQLVAEVFLYKSSGSNLTNDSSKPLWHKVLVQPFKNIYGGALSRSKISFDFTSLTKADTYKNAWHNLNDLETATKRDIAAASVDSQKAYSTALDARTKLKQFKDVPKHIVEAEFKEVLKRPNAPTLGKLSNKWSVRSGLAGICAMTVTTIFPDDKDSPELTEKMVVKAANDPLGYVGLRLYQAVNPLQWFEHKRQFSGFGLMGAGFFSFISGFRQVAGKYGLDAQRYLKNPWHMVGGLITAVAGTRLLLATDSQKGWSDFGTTQFLRLTTLPNSIHHRFKYNEQGGNWYLGAQTLLQIKNLVAVLIGGAQKMPDGTIVDYKKVREDVSGKIHAEHKEKKHHTKNIISSQLGSDEVIASKQPENTIKAVEKVQLAMPERRVEETAQEVA